MESRLIGRFRSLQTVGTEKLPDDERVIEFVFSLDGVVKSCISKFNIKQIMADGFTINFDTSLFKPLFELPEQTTPFAVYPALELVKPTNSSPNADDVKVGEVIPNIQESWPPAA